MVAVNLIKQSTDVDDEDAHLRAVRRQQAYADLLSESAQRAGGDKVYGNTLGIAKVGSDILAGLWGRKADEQERSEQAAADEQRAAAYGRLYGGGSDAVSAGAGPVDETGDGGRARGMAYARATKGIESGGNYGALGPVTKSGDRAYGAYQVMGANIGPWSREALGRELTKEQFIADKDAQDRIYQAKFGQYAQKYGPEGAFKAWFAGEGGMNNPNARDQLGTTVAEYGRRGMRALGPSAPANPTSTMTGAGGTPTMAGGSGRPAGDFSMEEIQALARNPRTRDLATQLINTKLQERADAVTQQRALAAEQRKQAFEREKMDLDRSPLPAATAQQKVDIAQAGRAQQNVNVGGGSNAQIFGNVEKSAEAARAAASGLTSIQEARRAVERGGIFGTGAEARLGLQKVATYFGADPKSVVNTETFRSAIAPAVAAMVKSTVGATNISNSDREFAMAAAGGSINLDEKSILRLLDIQERAQMNVLDEHQKRIDTIYPEGPEYQRERSLFSIKAPPGSPVRVQTPEEADRLPPGSRFITPDGRIGTVPMPTSLMTPAPSMAPNVVPNAAPSAVPNKVPSAALPGSGMAVVPPGSVMRGSGRPLPYSAYPTTGVRG